MIRQHESRTQFCESTVSLLLLLLATACATTALAQTPGVLWTKSLGARLFAVDSQTNVYANAGGSVITLNGAGLPLATNSICPLPGLAQRDAQGNFYFAGRFTAPQDFGGIVLTGGHCFLAKYTFSGTLIWAVSFGPGYYRDRLDVNDMQIEPGGGVYVAYSYNVSTLDHFDLLAHFDSSGSNTWSINLPVESQSNVTGFIRLGKPTAYGGYVINFYRGNQIQAHLVRFGTSGNLSAVTNWITPYASETRAARPILNSVGEIYNVEGSLLTKRSSTGTVLWTTQITGGTAWSVGEDQYSGVHVSSDNNQLSRYDSEGNPAWTMDLGSPCNEMVLDASQNRFFSLFSGVIGRIGAEPLTSPSVTNAPLGQTVLAGSNAVFTVGASGSTPLRYLWLFNSSPLVGQTNAILTLTNVSLTQAGQYSVVVTNFGGAITSVPALLLVKSVAIFAGNELLTNGTYVFQFPPTLAIRSAFSNGSIFYTLDGSAPSFSSKPYSGPFALLHSATLRAIGYSADFLQSEEADVVTAVLLTRHTLSVLRSGGGIVGSFPSNCITPPSGLVVSWRGEGTTIDSISTNDASIQGTLTYTQGVVGQAFSFNNQSGLVVPPSSSLNVGLGNGFSIETWFKWDAYHFAPIVQWNSPSSLAQYIDGYAGIIGYNPGILEAGFTVGNSYYAIRSANGAVTSNQVHHAALTFDRLSGTAVLYLDGHVVAQTNQWNFTPRTSDSLCIGILLGTPTYYPEGFIDEVSIYGRGLSAPEVQSIYQAGSFGKCVPVPVAGSYLDGNSVPFTAVPSPGYSFLYWLGDLSGTNPAATFSMDRDKAIQAVFGTALYTTVAGNGQILRSPTNDLYPYGSVVRFTAVPQPGNYFGTWGNAASGNTNPLYFTLTNPNPTVSSIFGPTPAGQSALTVLINGNGRVAVNPPANVYPTSQTVSLTANPDPGQTFLGWSGDATGADNPLPISMSSPRVISANFTARPSLRVDRFGLEGLTSDGFRFTVVGDPLHWIIQGSTNLTTWQTLGIATNVFGEVQFTDHAATNLLHRFYKAQSAE